MFELLASAADTVLVQYEVPYSTLGVHMFFTVELLHDMYPVN